MSETQQRTDTAGSGRYAAAGVTPTGWVGWIAFAGIMLVLEGSIQIIQGLVALFDDGYYLVTPAGLVVDVDYNAWGWVHLLLGVVALATGLGLLRGQMWARVTGVVLAVLSALVNIAFLAAYPIWSTVVIAVDVIVIYAIVVHGREAKVLYR